MKTKGNNMKTKGNNMKINKILMSFALLSISSLGLASSDTQSDQNTNTVPQTLYDSSINGVTVGSMTADKIIPVNNNDIIIEPGSNLGSIAILENRGKITIKRKPKNLVANPVVVNSTNPEILSNT